MSDSVQMTYKELLYSNNFWQKMVHTPVTVDKHSYWLGKLHSKIESAQKKASKELMSFAKNLGDKYGQKDKDGNVIIANTGLPAPKPETREEYEDTLDQFLKKEVTVDADKLPLEYFSHLQKTPLDWAVLETIAQFGEKDLDGPTTKSHLSSVS